MISVVIPTLRRPALLHRCLQALSRQSLSNEQFEVIVVSDGPDDSTKDTVEIWKKEMTVLYYPLPEKKGPAAARNAGWKRANGSVIAFTDDDCVPDKDWLSAFSSRYANELYAAYSGSIIVPVSEAPTDFERNTQGLEKAEFVTANCACTKAALEVVEGFDESFTMAWREDSDLEFKLLQHDIPVKRVEEAVIVHPVRQAPWGVSIKEQKKGMFNALLYKKYPSLYRQKIQPRPPIDYYVMIVAVVALLTGLLIHRPWVSTIAGIVWLVLIIRFITRRLSSTSHSFNHIAEMVATSLVIPFLSVYWQLYGALKYRVLFW